VFDEPYLSKATIQVSFVMTLVVVLGVFAVSAMLKLNGYGKDFWGNVKWNSFAVFVRHHGFQFLWLPLVWTCFAVVVQRRDQGKLYPATFWIGVMLAGSMMAVFFYTAWALTSCYN
jgi:hypothetical protein